MIVMKFGGTSVGSQEAILRLVEIIKQYEDQQPIIVVSAMSGVTNQLIEAANLHAAGNNERSERIISEIKSRHIETANLVVGNNRAEWVERLIEANIRLIEHRIKSIKGSLPTPTELDAIMGMGEYLSSTIVTYALKNANLNARDTEITTFLVTDTTAGNAEVNMEITRPNLRKLFNDIVRVGEIPVTQGFVGSSTDGTPTTLGRGGSDYTASIIGAAVGAKEIQIWTDVNGIMTTDPRVVPSAQTIGELSYEAAAELAYFGAKVIHPLTIAPAIHEKIPVKVLNSFEPKHPGSTICPNVGSTTEDNPIIAIAFKRNITVIKIKSSKMLLATGFLASIFEIFRNKKVSVDMIATSEISVSMTIDNESQLHLVMQDLQKLGEVTVDVAKTLVCLVGESLQSIPGVAARIFSALKDVNISMISHGASNSNVSLIIGGEDTTKAIRNLHQEFFLT